MKGIVFTELIEMVESDLGIDIADRMIANANVSNQGAYTAVGTYDHGELIRMVIALSEETGISVPDLVRAFGRHMFAQFSKSYPQFFDGIDSAIDFLPMVETYIHVEVRKLYPDAELPTFDCTVDDGVLEMTYRSRRPFADLADGLIRACIEHFGDSMNVTRVELGAQDGTEAKFTLNPIVVGPEERAPQPCPT